MKTCHDKTCKENKVEENTETTQYHSNHGIHTEVIDRESHGGFFFFFYSYRGFISVFKEYYNFIIK